MFGKNYGDQEMCGLHLILGSTLFIFSDWCHVFRAGFWGGMAYTGFFYICLRSMEPWTLKHGKKDNEMIDPKENHNPIKYPKPDGKITFVVFSL